MLKAIEINQYLVKSPFSQIHPFLKSLTLIIIAFALLLIDSVQTLAWINVFCFLIVLAARLDRKHLIVLVTTLLFAIYGIAFSQGLFYNNYPRHLFLQLAGFELFSIRIELNLWTEGLIYGLKMSLRFTAPLMLAFIIYLTTSTQEYLESMARSKIPFEIAFMITIAIRFIPIVFEDYRSIRIVQKLKGYHFSIKRLFSSLKHEARLFVPLFFHSLRHSRKLAEAIVGRAYKTGIKRRRLAQQFSGIEYVYLLLIMIVFFSFLLIKGLSFLYQNNLFVNGELRSLYEFARFYL